MHLARMALSLALAKAGRSIAARIAMMAITTNNSINVNPLPGRCLSALPFWKLNGFNLSVIILAVGEFFHWPSKPLAHLPSYHLIPRDVGNSRPTLPRNTFPFINRPAAMNPPISPAKELMAD